LPNKEDNWFEEAVQMLKPVKLRLPNVDKKHNTRLKMHVWQGKFQLVEKAEKR